MTKREFCVVIPALNEEKVISSSLRSLKNIFNKKDIYVVSDGSTDRTVSLARKEEVFVLDLGKNHGKALAQEKIIDKYQLIKRYKYVLFSDADSELDPNFLEEIKVHLAENPALIVGTVKSRKKGLISAFRTFEYGLSHRVYKNAQNFVRVITVAPGCASMYSSKVLKKLDLKNGTLTEDFDLTIQIHQRKLGEVVYVSKAIVVTQDPLTIKDYWRQVLRWNTGTWQNYFQHKLHKINSKYNFELNFLFLDNFIWIASLTLAIFYPSIILNIVSGMFATIYVCAFLISIIEKKWWIIPYILLFPVFYIMNIISYFYALFRVAATIKKHQRFAWNKVGRY